jgi:hypothetical protein
MREKSELLLYGYEQVFPRSNRTMRTQAQDPAERIMVERWS